MKQQIPDESWNNIENPWNGGGISVIENELRGEHNQLIAKYKLEVEKCPPQPYQGTPNAEIWVLLANPRYLAGKVGKDAGDDSVWSDLGRRKTYEELLKFNKPKDGEYYNYILNDTFDGYYGRTWFIDRFIGENKLLSSKEEKEALFGKFGETQKVDACWSIDKRFFLLQAFAYASNDCQEIPSPDVFKHMEFNQKLLRWALTHGKIVVIGRAAKYWNGIIESVSERDESKIFVMLNPRNVSFSDGNIITYEAWKSMEKCRECGKEAAKKGFEVIKSELESCRNQLGRS